MTPPSLTMMTTTTMTTTTKGSQLYTHRVYDTFFRFRLRFRLNQCARTALRGPISSFVKQPKTPQPRGITPKVLHYQLIRYLNTNSFRHAYQPFIEVSLMLAICLTHTSKRSFSFSRLVLAHRFRIFRIFRIFCIFRNFTSFIIRY